MKQDMAVCDVGAMSTYEGVSAIAILGTVLFAGAAHMVGEFLNNARIIIWARTELVQSIFSLFIAIAVFAILSMFCILTFYDSATFLGMEGAAITATDPAAGYGFVRTDTITESADKFLLWQLSYAHSNLAAIRVTMGAIELRASVSSQDCQLFCLLGGATETSSPHSGEYSALGALSIILNSATVSVLALLFQIFTLKYIESGLFLLFLPLGLILRAVPFFRGAGGSLIALVIAMYIFYPTILTLEAIFWPPVFTGLVDTSRISGDIIADEQGITMPSSDLFWNCVSGGTPDPFPLGQSYRDPEYLFKLNAVVFIAAVFLPALNFIIIGSVAASLSRMIGEEMDISRLSQMV